jgi:hypothetical protein
MKSTHHTFYHVCMYTIVVEDSKIRLPPACDILYSGYSLRQ